MCNHILKNKKRRGNAPNQELCWRHRDQAIVAPVVEETIVAPVVEEDGKRLERAHFDEIKKHSE